MGSGCVTAASVEKYVCMQTFVFVCVYIYMYMHIHIGGPRLRCCHERISQKVYVHANMCVWVCVYIYVYMNIRHRWPSAQVLSRMHQSKSICTCKHVCLGVCIYIYVHEYTTQVALGSGAVTNASVEKLSDPLLRASLGLGDGGGGSGGGGSGGGTHFRLTSMGKCLELPGML